MLSIDHADSTDLGWKVLHLLPAAGRKVQGHSSRLHHAPLTHCLSKACVDIGIGETWV